MPAPILPYKALALQTTCYAINACETPLAARNVMFRTVDRIHAQIQASKAYIGNDLKLVVLPEYFLTGFPLDEPLALWQQKGCLPLEGEVYDAVAQIAVDLKVYLSGNSYEIDPHFPDMYFQSSYIINPDGKFILRYRKLICMESPTPYDIMDKYISHYGIDSFFPIVKTDIGVLACISGEEIMYPEIIRSLVLRGAEIICHNTSEMGSLPTSHQSIARQARAIENIAYLISANSAGIEGTALPAQSTNGHSQIVHFEGHKLCEAFDGESMAAYASIDLHALRQHRRTPSRNNYLAKLSNELFLNTYNRKVHAANGYLNQRPKHDNFSTKQAPVIDNMVSKGIIQ